MPKPNKDVLEKAKELYKTDSKYHKILNNVAHKLNSSKSKKHTSSESAYKKGEELLNFKSKFYRVNKTNSSKSKSKSKSKSH